MPFNPFDEPYENENQNTRPDFDDAGTERRDNTEDSMTTDYPINPENPMNPDSQNPQPIRREGEWPDPSPKRGMDETPDDPRVPQVGDPQPDPMDIPRTDQNPIQDPAHPHFNPADPNYPSSGTDQPLSTRI